MISNELRNAIVELQLAVLEKVAKKQNLALDRTVLEHVLTTRGVAEAYKSLHQPPSAPPPEEFAAVPLPEDQLSEPSLPAPILQVEPEPTSLLRRLAQRWFGLS